MAKIPAKNRNTSRARGATVNAGSTGSPMVNGPRTEGQRRLLEVPDSLSTIAERCGVGKTVVSYWRSGVKTPGPGPRGALRDAYGIDPGDWDLRPSTGSTRPQSPTHRVQAPRPAPSGKPTTLEEVEEQLTHLYALQGQDVEPSVAVRLADSVGKLLAIKARLERENELLEDKVVRSHPFWRRLKAAVLEALKRHPDAARDVAEALERVEGAEAS